MKTPLTYYGGKQKLAALIRHLIPDHVLSATTKQNSNPKRRF